MQSRHRVAVVWSADKHGIIVVHVFFVSYPPVGVGLRLRKLLADLVQIIFVNVAKARKLNFRVVFQAVSIHASNPSDTHLQDAELTVFIS